MFEANRWSNVGVKDVLAAGTNFISGLWSGGPGAGHSLLTVRKFLRHEQYQDARDFFQANRSDFTQSMLEPNEWAILTSVEKAKKEEAVVEDDDDGMDAAVTAAVKAYKEKHMHKSAAAKKPEPKPVSDKARLAALEERLAKMAEAMEQRETVPAGA